MLTFVGASTAADTTVANPQTMAVTIGATGHILFLYVENASGVLDATVSVSGVGGTWIKVGLSNNDADIWYNTTYNVSGAQTLTVNLSAAYACRLTFAEYSGQIAAGNPLDAFVYGTGAGVNISSTIVTGFTNDTLIMWTGTNSGGTTFTTSSGMTSRTTGFGMSLLDINEAAAGRYTMTGSWDANPFGSNDTLIAIKSTTSVQAASGDLGPGYDFKFRM